MSHLLQWERVGTWGKWNMDRQHCFMSWLSVCPDSTFLILHFISVFTQMGYVCWDKKTEEKMAICHLLYVQVFHYLLFSLLHSVPPHLLFGYIRFAVILHLLAGVTSRVCKEPPSGACYQSCMFSLHLPSLPLWLVDKFFGCTCFHGLIVSTDLQQYLC